MLIAAGLGEEYVTIEFTQDVTLEQHKKICCFSGSFELGHRRFRPGHKLKVTAIHGSTQPQTRTLFLTGERESTLHPDMLVDVPRECFRFA